MIFRILLLGILVVAVVLADILITTFWFFSIIFACYCVGYVILKQKKGNHVAARRLIFAAVSSLIATTVFGYTASSLVHSDVMACREAMGSAYPKDLREVLSRKEISWISRSYILAYSNADGSHILRMREFPYKIVDFDWVSGKFESRPYD